jgi:amino acid adenylation domain-containing protein
MRNAEDITGADELSVQKRKLLEQWLEEEGIELSQARTMTAHESLDSVAPPLSFAQQRLWFLGQLEPDSPFYNIPVAVRLDGALNLQALEESFNEIIRRHEILRTTFAEINGAPVQVVASEMPLEIEVNDLSDAVENEREAEALSLMSEEARRPFEINKGPLLRVKLMRFNEDKHILLLTMHHVISDGWSMSIFIQEMAALYEAFSQGKSSPLSGLPFQYADFAIWQREWSTGEALQDQLAYWKRQLDGLTPVLDLPTDHPRPAVQKYRGTHQAVLLPKRLSEELMALSRREEATLFMTLLAAFDALLYRYTGQEDFAVGAPIANRTRAKIQELIGFFVNTLVLRADLSGDPTFRELLERVKETALGAYAHQDVPFEELLEQLQPARDMSRQPLFQVVFVLQNTPLPPLKLAGLNIRPIEIDNGTSKFDLTLGVEETAEGLKTSLEYNTDLFDALTIARMLDHFLILLEGIVADPDRRISELPMLTATERRQLLHEKGRRRSEFDRNACLQQLFEEQAARTPDATALIFEDERLTYAELNRRANQLAHHLLKHGVGPGTLVGLMTERAIEMVIGLLGILKAGGAYVPLDPQYPRERLSFMLADAQIPVLLTQRELIGSLPGHPARAVCLDADWEVIAQESTENPPVPVQPEHPAYVIYTSGSMGQPKGVLVTHANVTRLFSATEQWFHFSQQDVWTLFHSYAFDFSVWELWGALLYGGRLVIVSYLTSRSPEAFYELMVREGVTVLNQTPSAFRQLMRVDELAVEREKLRLRLIIFGGEALELQSLAPWFARHGDEHPRLVNMYGITETTVHVTYRPLRMKDLEQAVGSVIGEPIPDLSVYVLGRHLQPVPVGVAGELYIGGEGLARGYLNRPELTAERFIPHPFGEEPGARLYRTGDRARFLADGDIEYLGRLDQQVKIKGFRIELQEIEATLNEHPAIRECIVTVNEKESEAKRLIAYVVARSEQSLTVDELRRFVKERLPDYMMPAAFIFLETLPLTPQGKIDLKALPAPDHERPLMERAFVAPRNRVEEILAGIWSDVLGVKQVGIDDNYFTLGGDSIRSIQVRAKAEGQGLRLSIPQLFQYQTIRELARSSNVTDAEPTLSVKVEPFGLISAEERRRLPEDVEDAYPLSHLQAGLVFHSEYSPDYIIYLSSFHLRAPLDVEQLQAALHQLVTRHAMMRTSFDLTNFSEPLQLVQHTATIPIMVEDISHLSPGEQETWLDAWMEKEMRRRFNWTSSPLMRLHIHRREHGAFQLTLSEPFLDGWSVASLITELFERYFALLAGTPLSVEPPLSASYGDFVALEREALASEDSRRYWTSKLDDANASKLPHRSATQQTDALPRVSRVDVSISPEISEGLVSLARSAGIPLKSVLLAGHCKVIGLWSGQTDVFTGLFVNGRPETTDGEKILGIFLNILPFRLDLEGATWAELVRQSFEAEREMMPFRRFPIQELQHSYGAENLFETSFNYTHFHVYQRLQHVQGLEPLAHLGTEQTYYALTAQFNLDEAASRITLALDYRELELYKEQVEEIADSYIRVLAAMVSNPSARQESSCLLSEREQHQLLAEWNDTHVDYPQGKCFHTLFEEQSERTPDAIALVFEHQCLTYRELNQRANQVGHYLQSLGIGPEMPVAICMERSLEMVVSLLGILKAGGAYVPLDPQYPRERLSFTLEDAQAKFLLTQRRLVGIMPQGVSRIVCIDEEWEAIACESTAHVCSHATADNLAYLIYTSGSTGKPKGAAIEHHSTLGLMHWAGEMYAESIAGVLAATSLCFDMSIFELFVPLSWGGAAIIAENALQLPTMPSASQVTLISTVPSAMTELVRTDGVPATVRTVTLAGEVLQHKLVHQIYEQTGIREVWNLYGLSEDTSYSISALIEKGEPESLTIGRPLPNRQAYILDKHLQPVHVGVAGELYVSGEGLARCYVNRPELTAERFLPNPYRVEAGARMYKTGDLARYRRDGTIECLGRIDHQVKVRGYRIELGEIESVLDEHPEVKESAVLAREDVPGEKRLVAYVVPQQEAQPSGVELRSYLKERLPKFMVPTIFMMLDEMPLTANGKVDRRAFPAPDQATPSTEESFVAPRTPVEELLCDIWAQVFHVEQVSIHDNFFDLGGHSLLATRLISRIREAFHVELSIRSLFESPTIAGLSTRVIRAMSAAREQPAPPILPVSRSAPLPLSFAQQRLWFLDRLESGSAFYNIPIAVRLAGPLNVDALEQSFNEIIRRHEILRTSFHELEGKPVQVIAPSVSLSFRVEDFGGMPRAEGESAAQRFALEEAQHPFDLTDSPLLRVNLLRLNDEEHILLATLHHIVSDGWSMNIFVQEMTALYKAFAAGESSPLAALRIQYGDFAVWQREWLRDGVLLGQLAYWKEQLAGAPPVLELPTDWPRPKVQTFRGAKYPLMLPETLSRDLKEFNRRKNVTLFMTLLAAFKVLLYYYTRQTDLVVGTSIANRNRAEIEELIGFFVNTLVLRTDLSGDPTFSELLDRVREVSFGAYAHQDLPFEKLVEELQPERRLSQTPLFQVMLVLENATETELELEGLRISPLKVDSGSAKFDLTLLVQETPEGLGCLFEYNTDLFKPATITRMAGHYEMLLRHLLMKPESSIGELEIIGEQERREILFEFNRTEADFPRGKCVHELFEEQVARTPDALAIIFEEERLSYQELNVRSNQLAQHLRALGVGPEVKVALYVERSTEMLVGILGILKAGAAYLPLDPHYPPQRISFMLANVAVEILLTQQRLLKRLPPHAAKVICLDADWTCIAQEREDNLPNRASADNLAYIIYTSGSTGQPKGSMIQHRSLVNHALNMVKVYELKPGRRMMQFFSLSFDASAEDFFPTLLSGATLVCHPDPFACTVPEFLTFCEHHHVTTLHLPVVYWHELVDRLASDGLTLPACVEVLSVGGESPSAAKLQTWAGCTGRRVKFRNVYGPTETTVTSTVYETVDEIDTTHGSARVPIGRPINNTQIYLLDQHLRPVPLGVPGELYIGGVGLARGYLNRPDATAEKFIPNPFSGAPGARLYKTGDHARYLPDRNIVFLGRGDQQVKIRGYRIELGEIEAALVQHAQVREAVVVAREDRPGDSRLAAYVLSIQERTVTGSELRDYLAERLPEYMVPPVIMFVDQWPLTPNGKVDRRALPPPMQMLRAEEYVAPRTSVEEVLASIWAEVLGVERVGVNDNFFELGGHSLLATQMMTQVRESLQVELVVRSLFEAPTVAGLSAVLLEVSNEPEKTVETADLLLKLAQLADDEVEAMLDQRRQSSEL